jgi:hypothetical protein
MSEKNVGVWAATVFTNKQAYTRGAVTEVVTQKAGKTMIIKGPLEFPAQPSSTLFT